MQTQALKTREETKLEDRWNIESLYADINEWKEEFQKLAKEGQNFKLPDLQAFKGRLDESPATLKKALDSLLEANRKLEKLYVYAHLRHDEDISDEEHKKAYGRALSLIHDIQQETAWFEPELLSIPKEQIIEYLQAPELGHYSFHLEKSFRLKPHTLSYNEELLMALSGKALQTAYKTFSAINDADFDFGLAEDSKKNQHPVTHGSYSLYLMNRDRVLRKNAFSQLYQVYHGYENTLCELLSGQVNANIFKARARKYPSALQAALFPNNIPKTVYHSLIQAVNENLPSLHRYMKLRKEILGLDEMRMYDLYAPLSSEIDIQLTYAEAEQKVVDSVQPLGAEYQDLLRQGMLTDQWVDRYENKNKRSGAYSSGCYDSSPFILMNYNGSLRDVFTLAHEAGHSMHSLMSKISQPYHYSSYPIFVAEVASTFNEELLMELFLQQTNDPAMTFYLINQKLDDIRATLFRQTMFAEFELKIYEMEENNQPLTPSFLKEYYRGLNEKYFGTAVTIDPEIENEWSRIPHFYYNFYVYQYSTGISAALALSEKVINGGDKERNAYLQFLQGGCHKYSIELLKEAGVDMTTPEPVNTAIRRFDSLLDQLEQLYKKLF